MQTRSDTVMSQEIQRNKTAIYHALRTIFTKEEAETALDTWVNHFSASPSAFSGINLFARTICQIHDKTDRQRELLQALSRALLNRTAHAPQQFSDIELMPDAGDNNIAQEHAEAPTQKTP